MKVDVQVKLSCGKKPSTLPNLQQTFSVFFHSLTFLVSFHETYVKDIGMPIGE
jgi:hypothetical protein